ncbi:MAG: pilus assembly protein [Hyphomicrobiales bacterium]|nr:pilus assembly protein [Hyphomicrobiales bacterium]
MFGRSAGTMGRAAKALHQRFTSDQRGVSAIEFGMLAVPFFGVLMGIFMNSYVLFSQTSLDYAVYHAARQVMTGQIQNNSTIVDAKSFIQQVMCGPTTNLPSYMNCNNLQVDMRVLPNFASSDPAAIFAPGGTQQFCPGSGSSYVMLSVNYPLPTLFPLLTGWVTNIGISNAGSTLDANGHPVRMLESSIVLRNEPFTSTTTLPGC